MQWPERTLLAFPLKNLENLEKFEIRILAHLRVTLQLSKVNNLIFYRKSQADVSQRFMI